MGALEETGRTSHEAALTSEGAVSKVKFLNFILADVLKASKT